MLDKVNELMKVSSNVSCVLGVYVENLSIFVVRDTAEVLALLKLGKKKLIIGETRMNRFSSRYYCGSYMLYGNTVLEMITRFKISNFLNVIFAFIFVRKRLLRFTDFRVFFPAITMVLALTGYQNREVIVLKPRFGKNAYCDLLTLECFNETLTRF